MTTKFIEEQIQNLQGDESLRSNLVKLRILGSGVLIPEHLLTRMARDLIRWRHEGDRDAFDNATVLLTISLNVLDKMSSTFPFKLCKTCDDFDDCSKAMDQHRQSQLDTSNISIEKLVSIIGEC